MIRLVSVDREEGTADKLVNMIPDVPKKVKEFLKRIRANPQTILPKSHRTILTADS